MSEKTVKLIYTVYGIVTSVLLILTGILLMISCVQVYRIGNRPFTVENISNAFSKICIPVYITIGAVIIAFVLWLVKPLQHGRAKASINKRAMLARLEKKLDVNACDADAITLIEREKKLRKTLRIAAIAICVVSAVPALLHVFNFNNFGADYNGAVIAACLWILPCFLIAAGACIAYMYIASASLDRQIKHVKSAIAKNGSATGSQNACKNSCRRNKLTYAIRFAVAVIAIVLIVAGIFNGGMADVLSKAINICTECIGLG